MRPGELHPSNSDRRNRGKETMKRRLTTAQAIVQFSEKSNTSHATVKSTTFFEGCFGIFGHGNVAGMGQALEQNPDFPYYLCRNEQAMVHTAAAFAKMSNRLRTLACTTSIGPGATNMVTGAAVATINRLPVLLLAGRHFRPPQCGSGTAAIGVAYYSGYFSERLFQAGLALLGSHPAARQILTSLPEAMRVLTSQAETGAVILALPQDVQAEAFDYPDSFSTASLDHPPASVATASC